MPLSNPKHLQITSNSLLEIKLYIPLKVSAFKKWVLDTVPQFVLSKSYNQIIVNIWIITTIINPLLEELMIDSFVNRVSLTIFAWLHPILISRWNLENYFHNLELAHAVLVQLEVFFLSMVEWRPLQRHQKIGDSPHIHGGVVKQILG